MNNSPWHLKNFRKLYVSGPRVECWRRTLGCGSRQYKTPEKTIRRIFRCAETPNSGIMYDILSVFGAKPEHVPSVWQTPIILLDSEKLLKVIPFRKVSERPRNWGPVLCTCTAWVEVAAAAATRGCGVCAAVCVILKTETGVHAFVAACTGV